MTAREKVLGVALLVVAAGGVAYYTRGRFHGDDIVLPQADAKYVLPDAIAHELDQVHAAQQIDSSVGRCLAYPDPPELSWDPKAVKALCNLYLRRMISWQAIKAALDQHRPDVLQQIFDSYLERTYHRGEHGFLVWTYWWMFQNASKEELDTTNRWIDEDPKSAYAIAARGMHFVAAAWDARGTDFVYRTPRENLDRMHDFADKASADLKESLRRNPRLIAAYHGLIEIAELTGDSELLDSSARSALALDPADHWIYDDWMAAVDPKWGGSSEEMQTVAELAARHARENPLLKRMLGVPTCVVANEYACSACRGTVDYAKALDLYREAGKFGPSKCFLNGAGWAAEQAGDLGAAAIYYGQAVRFFGDDDDRLRLDEVLPRIGRAEWAVEDTNKLLKDNPKYIRALDARAYALEFANKPREAEASYRAMLDIDPNNERAALQLSRLYLTVIRNDEKAKTLVNSLLQRNPKLARAWLYKAALAHGDEAACRAGLEAYLKYVDRNDSYEKFDIARAEARLRQLDREAHS